VLAGRRLTDDGILVIDAREHRTQAQNREAARARLFHLIEASRKAPRKRRPTRPTKSSKETRLRSKQQRAQIKRQRTSRQDE
jgi:ribosome-associated protein